MHGTAHKLFFFALLIAMVSLAYGINYQYFSENEETVFGDRIKFWHLDTLAGPVRSNDTLAIMENPPFYDFVITSAPVMWTGPEYNPQFRGQPPVLNAPILPLPVSASIIRQRAIQQELYYDGMNTQAWAIIMHDTLRIHWAQIGQPFDTLNYEDVILPDTADVFFDTPLQLSGVVSNVLVIGASGRIGLADNIVYASAGSDYNPPPAGHAEKFACVSEGEIKVLNTFANGRENSSGLGFSQTNQNLTNIVLDGIYVALNGSFTFDQQNQADSGYVCTPCGCVPGVPGQHPPSCSTGPGDDRGYIYLFGSLMQQQRGYVHRVCCNSTGYQKWYRYDSDLRYWNFGLFDSTYRENLVQPSALDFGEVLVGDTAWDTVRVYNDFIPVWLSHIHSRFIVPIDTDAARFVHRIPVGFCPVAWGEQFEELTFDIPYYNQSVTVPLHGIGVTTANGRTPALPAEFSFGVYPNPFNNTATLDFALPEAATVKIELFDIQGRRALSLADNHFTAGRHSLNVDGTTLASGVYLARLTTPKHFATTKLLLLK